MKYICNMSFGLHCRWVPCLCHTVLWYGVLAVETPSWVRRSVRRAPRGANPTEPLHGKRPAKCSTAKWLRKVEHVTSCSKVWFKVKKKTKNERENQRGKENVQITDWKWQRCANSSLSMPNLCCVVSTGLVQMEAAWPELRIATLCYAGF